MGQGSWEKMWARAENYENGINSRLRVKQQTIFIPHHSIFTFPEWGRLDFFQESFYTNNVFDKYYYRKHLKNENFV
jgi:hypothetical protein